MQVTLRGMIATDPRFRDDGALIFRCAETVAGVEHYANWFTVITRGALAEYAYEELKKANRILVNGELRIRDWDNGQVSGTTVEIEAQHLGLDLSWKPSPVHASEVL